MSMSRRSKGFLELEWVCPHCNSRNPGPQKFCANCGAPQPENVAFYRPAEAKLTQDEVVARLARAGPDVHCAFCSTRNPATATTCSQCGADLKQGRARSAGNEVPQAVKHGTRTCPACGASHPPETRLCSNCGAPLTQTRSALSHSPARQWASRRTASWWFLAGIGLFLTLAVLGSLLLFVPTKTVTATVDQVYWKTVVTVEEIQPVRYTGQEGPPPAGAYDISCHTETSQICEEKSIDTGTGYAEVIEECHEIITQFCSYTVDEWAAVQTYVQEGHSLVPEYAQPALAGRQRLGRPILRLEVSFRGANGETYPYSPGSLEEYRQYQPGSRWTLRLNALGGVVQVER